MIETAFKIIIIGVIIAFSIGLLGTVAFGWTLDTSPYLSGIANFLHIIYYVLPIGKLSPLIFIFISSIVFRTVVSLIKVIWNILPISS